MRAADLNDVAASDPHARAGAGELVFERDGAATVLRRARAHSPLRLLTPRNHGHASWVYLSTFGGGFVDGDRVTLEVHVGAGATAFVSTQGATRVYRSPRGCHSAVTARVGPGALLAYLPDPVALFAGARFEQSLDLALEPGASVLAWDVLSAGRVATGERWAFDRLSTTLAVRGEREWVRETLRLDGEPGAIPPRMGRFNAFATVIVAGPRLAEIARAFAEASRVPAPGAQLAGAASPVAEDAVVVRLAATAIEPLSVHLRAAVASLPALLGDDPLSRRA